MSVCTLPRVRPTAVHKVAAVEVAIVVPWSVLTPTCVVVGIATGLLPSAWRSRVAAVLACASAAVVLLATVVRPGQYPPAGWWPWEVWRVASLGPLWPNELRDQLNLVLLTPFAWFATLALGRPVLAAAVGVLLTCTVEYVQGAAGLGTPQLADLVHNSIGSVLGATVGCLALLAADRVSVSRRATGRHGLAA